MDVYVSCASSISSATLSALPSIVSSNSSSHLEIDSAISFHEPVCNANSNAVATS